MTDTAAHPINAPAAARAALGAMPALAILAALGLALVALGDNAARDSEGTLQPLFWGGLVLIYAPIAFRLLGASPGRQERIALVLTLGIALFMVKVLDSPLEYVRFDEMGWQRAVADLIGSGHAFTDNPINVATAGFPGLTTLTAAISQLSGLSVYHAGLIAIGAARAILMLALFLFLERVTRSSRAAGIGIAIYVCNPSFLYFDAQFGYESLALMIAAALLLAALRWAGQRRFDLSSPGLGLAAVLLLLACGLTVTHHMTSFAMLAFLLLWTGAAALSNRLFPAEAIGPRDLKGPVLPAAMMAVTVGIWFVFVAGSVTVDELGGVISRAFDSVVDLVLGNSGSKQLFSGSGQNEHFAARVLAIASVVPLFALIPAGLVALWRDRVRDPLWWALGAVATLYPVTLGLRLTLASSETSQRASEFVFLGVAFFAAMLSVRVRWPEWRGAVPVVARGAVTGLAAMCFVGGFIIGELQATRQPGPYLVGAEDRSVTPQGLAAADFAAARLPRGSRLLADRTNATLLGAHGGVDPIFGRYADISLPRILFSSRFDRADRRAIHGQSLAFIVVDRRLSRETPLIGYYVESDEPQAFVRTKPVSREALVKFESVPGVSKIYTNGPIVIYDTTALLR